MYTLLGSPRKLGGIAVTFFTAMVLLLPGVQNWAVRPDGGRPGLDPVGIQERQDLDPAALAYFQRNAPEDRGQPRRLSIGTGDLRFAMIPFIPGRLGPPDRTSGSGDSSR